MQQAVWWPPRFAGWRFFPNEKRWGRQLNGRNDRQSYTGIYRIEMLQCTGEQSYALCRSNIS